MKTFFKVIRWIVVILATTSILGYLMSALVGSASSNELWVAIFWLVVGSTALYYELKAEKKSTGNSPSRGQR